METASDEARDDMNLLRSSITGMDSWAMMKLDGIANERYTVPYIESSNYCTLMS